MSKLQNERARTQAGMADIAGGMRVAPAVRKPLGAMKPTPTPMGDQLTPSAPPIMSAGPMVMGKQVSQGPSTGYGSFRNTPTSTAETMIKKPRAAMVDLGGRGTLSDSENTKDF